MIEYFSLTGLLIEPERHIILCASGSVVEYRLAKARVASSNLVSRSIHSSIAQLVEQSAVNRSVVGSSPTRGAI